MTIFKSMTRGVAMSVLLAGVLAPTVAATTANAAAPDSGQQSEPSTPDAPTGVTEPDATTAPPATTQPATTKPAGTQPAGTVPAPTTAAPAATPAPSPTAAPTTTPPPAAQSQGSGAPGGEQSVDGAGVTAMSGQQAIDAVRAGAPLDLESSFPGRSVTRQQVIDMLAKDPSLQLVGNRLIYVEPRLPGQDAAPLQAPAPVSAADAANAFALHSRPGSNKKLYLDFNGHVSTAWNPGQTIRSAPYDSDGNPKSFSNAEREQIARWWSQVAADFDTWDVDVTTEEPPASYLTKTSPGDTTFGVRVVITDTSFLDAAGVAQLGSFVSSQDTPAYVFTDWVTPGVLPYVHQTISHEAGHTFGLFHDGLGNGQGANAYYGGHSNWAPIMGGGQIKDIVQWSKGEYNNANNREDDRQIIANVAGAPIDDYTTVAIGPNATKYGIINSAGDTDLFTIDTAGGTIKVSAAPNRPSRELDLALTLRNSAGSVVKSANVAGLAGETISVKVPAGRYSVVVDGVGARNPRTNGYSDYSSTGLYRIVASFAPGKSASGIEDNGYRNIDFDGDGKTDVFGVYRNGSRYQWRFSSGGVKGWKDLNRSTEPLDQLRFGDFDGDGKTDVFSVYRTGSRYQWRYSSGGVKGWKNLTRSTEPIDQLRFADIDGDGKTDVFSVYRSGSRYQWRYSSGGVKGWKNLTRSTEPLDQLRFADIDGDGKTDIFTAYWTGSRYQWRYSSGAVKGWKELTRSIEPLDQLRFADIDGDGKTDVFSVYWTGSRYQWRYSSGGVKGWKELTRSIEPLDQLRFADIDGDGKTDVFSAYRTGSRYQWRYSSGAAKGWKNLTRSIEPLDQLRLS